MGLDKLPKFDLNSVHASTFLGLPPPNNDCPNPLFLKWIAEKYQEANQRQSQFRHNLRKAYVSILQYPVAMLPQETKKLNGIGDTTVNMLQKKFNEYLKENGINPKLIELTISTNSSSVTISTAIPTSISADEQSSSPSPAPKPKKKRAKTHKEYIPAYQSGPYAILLALRMQLINQSIFDDHFTLKPQLIELAQPHCQVPLDRPLPGSRFTGWSCMRTLTTKELVEKRGSKHTKYGLTEAGFELGDKIYKLYCQNENLTYSPFSLNFEDNSTLNNENRVSSELREISLEGYKIILVIDNRELNTKNTEEFFQKECRKLGVDFCFRQLSVGDFMWIAQPPNSGGPDKEIVLDFVIERKAIDDLVMSIKDGRYKDQKARLQSCGAPKVIYLIENFTTQEAIRTGMPIQTIWTSLIHTQLYNDFIIKQTEDILATLKYAAFITQMLKSQYEDQVALVNYNPDLTKSEYKEQFELDSNLKICFQTYQLMNIKSQPMTVSDMFVKMLTCTTGISLTKALEMVKKHPTPLSLYRAFSLALDSKEEDNLFTSKSIIPSRSVSANLSKKVIGEWLKSHG